MKYFIWVLLLSPLTSMAGDWTRESDDTLKFSGKIEAGELDRFKLISSAEDRNLIVDSTGGDVEAGVRLGMELFKKKLTVIVDGLCVSTCANYVFTAGAKKEVKHGFVGYHGNIAAFLNKGWNKIASELRLQGTMSEIQIEDIHKRFTQSAQIEKEFLKLTGISQELFDKSQALDKGKGDGNEYHFLIPKLETFTKYGIANVSGIQDPNYSKELGLDSLYD
jgi:hypothetical protein